MKKHIIFPAIFLSALVLTSCGGNSTSASSVNPGSNTTSNGGNTPTRYSNENTPLVLSSAEVDGVFNPFYSTNAADSNIIGMTQLSMLSNDKEGNITYGEDEAAVVLDFSQEDNNGTQDEDLITTYNFVLKNDVKFSNGSPLTIKDVLFNLYVYLDPNYTGSSTIYSTDIVGLSEYRTQQESTNEQDSFNEQFEIEASQRIQDLISAADDILSEATSTVTAAQFESALRSNPNTNLIADYQKAVSLFAEELESDWNNSMNTAADITFTSENGAVLRNVFTTDVEAFLYNEGYITYNRQQNRIESSLTPDYTSLRSWTKSQAIAIVQEDKIPGDIIEILAYWQTGTNLREYLISVAKDQYFQDLAESGELAFKNISGITFSNRTEAVTVNGKTYSPVGTHYEEDGSVSEGYNEILTIQIHNVDPRAIWNFAFGVAPMYYYSDKAHIDAFDYEENFGVEYGSLQFYNEVVNAPSKVGVPVGAGAYVAAKSSGGTDGVTAGNFNYNNVIYFERNEHFVLGVPLIKSVRYQITPNARMIDVLQTGAVDFVQPNCKPEVIEQLNRLESQGYGQDSVQTSGYGYIGINAAKVPDLEVRRAIMHAINVQETVEYYGTQASPIYRSMSRSSWAYPTETDADGQYYKYDESGEVSEKLVIDAGYTKGGDGVYQKSGHKLQYTFTIAGNETDHPAYNCLYHAADVLNAHGFKINVTTDANALTKLTNGSLTVWAAAWGSTIDPDMYQVYHIDSTATSVTNWGYPAIKQNTNDRYYRELEIVQDLSEQIDAARETLIQSTRKNIYATCLDLVMDLAVELPTYQRNDLYAYNKNKIDESTFVPEAERSSYMSPISRLWEVGYVGNNNNFGK